MEIDELALGIDRNLSGLRQLAPHARSYRELGLDPDAADFADRIYDAIISAKHVHFDVSGMKQLGGQDGVLFGPAELNPLGSANWELRTIWDDRTLLRKTTFWRDGQTIDSSQLPLIS